MGQAKARGTFEQRKAQAVERERIESLRRSAEHRALMLHQQEERAKQRPQEGIARVLLAGASPSAQHRAAVMMAMAMSMAGSNILAIDHMEEATRRRYRRG